MQSRIPQVGTPQFWQDQTLGALHSIWSWKTAIAVVLLATILLSALLPQPLILPAFGIVMMISGFLLAAITSLLRPASTPERARSMDLAGMLVLLGCAASIMTDTQLALQAFDALQGSDVKTALGSG